MIKTNFCFTNISFVRELRPELIDNVRQTSKDKNTIMASYAHQDADLLFLANKNNLHKGHLISNFSDRFHNFLPFG